MEREPTGISADVFYVLGMYGPDAGLTVDELHARVVSENEAMGWPVPTRQQVKDALSVTLSQRGLVERPSRGRWAQTAKAARLMAVWVGNDEEPVFRPCGLGWPPRGLVKGAA